MRAQIWLVHWNVDELCVLGVPSCDYSKLNHIDE
jgi:hypothetical protein